jgi:hypothetical protein
VSEGRKIRLENPYVVWKMKNQDGFFWVSLTRSNFDEEESWKINVSGKEIAEEELKGKLILLSGNWKWEDGQRWKGWAFRVKKCYLLSDDFWITAWEVLPPKDLREIEE